uniref:Uncharacterized protein n=1 Tax=Equus asinus TaxID=9793 RepID=A0A9L0ICW1_EQUAS
MPPRPTAQGSGAPARSPSPGRSNRRGAAPTVLPRGGSRVHCLRGGGGDGGGGGRGGGAVSGRPGAPARARAASPCWLGRPAAGCARGGFGALTLRPVEAPRAESAVTRAARTTPPARPAPGGGRGRGLGGGQSGTQGTEPGGAEPGEQWGQPARPARAAAKVLSPQRSTRPPCSPNFPLLLPPQGPSLRTGKGAGPRIASPSQGWAFAGQVAECSRKGCLPGIIPHTPTHRHPGA